MNTFSTSFFVLSLPAALRPLKIGKHMWLRIQDGGLPLIRSTPVDLGSILWANRRTLFTTPLTRLRSRLLWLGPAHRNFLQQHFLLLSFAIRPLGIDAENFFHRIKVKTTSAKTDQTMWKRLRYTIFRLANTSLHQVYLGKTWRIYRIYTTVK